MVKVLLIDDKSDELQKAREAAERKGWESVVCDVSVRGPGHCNNCDWIDMVEDVDCVATDLMWDHNNRGEKPMGLCVVIHALSRGKPVVICTNRQDFANGHHGEAIGFIYDGYYTSTRTDPFGWEEGKDWDRAMEYLAKQMS
jgi:hypothetical protein